MCNYKRGDMQAMDELLCRYKNPVYHFLCRLVKNNTEAEDLAQEVFLRVHQYRHNYTPSGKFSTWIFSIAHNLFVSTLRKKKWLILWPRQKDDPEEAMDFASPDPTPEELATKSDTSLVVKECIQGLPFLQKEALVLREYEQLDYEEIAHILHKSLGTVKTLIHRARENLKIKLLPYIKETDGRIQ